MLYLTVMSNDVSYFAYHTKAALGAFWISENMLNIETRQGIFYTRISDDGKKYVFKLNNYFALATIAEKIIEVSCNEPNIMLQLEFTTDELFDIAGLEGIINFSIKNGRVKKKKRLYMLKEYDPIDTDRLISVFLMASTHKLTNKEIYLSFQLSILNDNIKKIDEATKDLYNIFR